MTTPEPASPQPLTAELPHRRPIRERGMTAYDALYAWCRDCREQSHDWNPAAMISAKA
jgi:hypothetical protein